MSPSDPKDRDRDSSARPAEPSSRARTPQPGSGRAGAGSPSASAAVGAVGNVLGGIARRVSALVGEIGESVTETVTTVTVPEAVRVALAAARDKRRQGDARAAAGVARAALAERPDDVSLQAALALAHVAAITCEQVISIDDSERTLGADKQEHPPWVELLRGAIAGHEGDSKAALEHARRARRGVARVPSGDRDEFRAMTYLVAAIAHANAGRHERTIREVQKARARARMAKNPAFAARVLALGAGAMLAAGRVADAERWVFDLHIDRLGARAEGDSTVATTLVDYAALAPDERAWLALSAAVRSDRATTEFLLGALADDARWSWTRARASLLLGDAEGARVQALQAIAVAPDDPQHRRTWALAELRDADASARPRGIVEALAALLRAHDAAQEDAQGDARDELAHIALAQRLFQPEVRTRLGLQGGVAARLDEVLGTHDAATPERAIYGLRRAWALGGDRARLAEEIVGGRWAPPPTPAPPRGPDEQSPLRRGDLGERLVDAHYQAVLASAFHLRGEQRAAADAAVRALAQDPDAPDVRALLTALTPQPEDGRLESLLALATSLLTSLPERVLGHALPEPEAAVAAVIHARERLARPLSIAIMGEFSSGKSSVINALLGEVIAPTGVLPTTATINVFRPGPTGVARVYYRDGTLATVARDEVSRFLHGLDAVEADRIRYVEIERRGPGLADAAVVDTPGLNALDSFHEKVAREFLAEADAVVWVFSATRGSSASEADVLAELRADGRRVIGVLNKVDTLSPAEIDELSAYLREQLGDRLMEVIPFSALQARPPGADPAGARDRGDQENQATVAADDAHAALERARQERVEAVRVALRSHFVERTRAIKRELTTRRFEGALREARRGLTALADTLEREAGRRQDSDGRDASAATGAHGLLREVCTRTTEGLRALDEGLSKEWLNAGVVEIGAGVVAAVATDRAELSYLDAVIEDRCEALVRAEITRLLALAAARPRDRDFIDALVEVLSDTFVPWSRGFVHGARHQGLTASWVSTCGPAAKQGERALQAALRTALAGVAEAWSRELMALSSTVSHRAGERARLARDTPLSEALRLRALAVAGIDTILDHLGRSED